MALLDTTGPHAGIPTLAEEHALMPQQERVFARWLKDKKLDRAVADLHPDDVIRLARSAYFAGVRTYGQ